MGTEVGSWLAGVGAGVCSWLAGDYEFLQYHYPVTNPSPNSN